MLHWGLGYIGYKVWLNLDPGIGNLNNRVHPIFACRSRTALDSALVFLTGPSVGSSPTRDSSIWMERKAIKPLCCVLYIVTLIVKGLSWCFYNSGCAAAPCNPLKVLHKSVSYLQVSKAFLKMFLFVDTWRGETEPFGCLLLPIDNSSVLKELLLDPMLSSWSHYNLGTNGPTS